MALGCALREPCQAPDHPRIKGQQAGADLRDDPLSTYTFPSGILQE